MWLPATTRSPLVGKVSQTEEINSLNKKNRRHKYVTHMGLQKKRREYLKHIGQ